MNLFRMLVGMVSVLVFITACDLDKKTDRMDKNTEELRKTSEKISANSEKLNKDSGEIKDYSGKLAKRTEDIEAEAGREASHRMLMYHLDMLFGENSFEPSLQRKLYGLNEEPDLLVAAGGAIESMRFQLWKGDFLETTEVLDIFLEKSLEPLFVRLLKHIPRHFDVDVGSFTKRTFELNRSYKGLASLAVKIDRLDPRFEKAVADAGLAKFTLYDLFVEALHNRRSMQRKELFPRATAKILQYEKEVEYLLQLRHNYFQMMVLARLTDFQDRNLFRRAVMWWSGQTVELSANPEQLSEWSEWLRLARKTRADLRALGLQPRYNMTFADLVSGVDFGQRELVKSQASKPDEQLKQNFAQLYIEVAVEAQVGSKQPAIATDKPAQEKEQAKAKTPEPQEVNQNGKGDKLTPEDLQPKKPASDYTVDWNTGVP
jgi:hypothetical protein